MTDKLFFFSSFFFAVSVSYRLSSSSSILGWVITNRKWKEWNTQSIRLPSRYRDAFHRFDPFVTSVDSISVSVSSFSFFPTSCFWHLTVSFLFFLFHLLHRSFQVHCVCRWWLPSHTNIILSPWTSHVSSLWINIHKLHFCRKCLSTLSFFIPNSFCNICRWNLVLVASWKNCFLCPSVGKMKGTNYLCFSVMASSVID